MNDELHGNTVTHQYFFRTNGCPAKSTYDADCLCWHDEGSGPYPDGRYGDLDSFTWRIKADNA